MTSSIAVNLCETLAIKGGIIINTLETRGRLWLWHSAVSECQKLLALADRSKFGEGQSHIKSELDLYNKELWAYCKSRPDYIEGQIKSSDQMAFDRSYERPYPTWAECQMTHDACIELAVVYFCQILNTGYEDTGNAAKNDKPFREENLDIIASIIFNTQSELDKFHTLCEELQNARNQMIGHADGKAFQIQHGGQLSRMSMYRQAWQDIDLEYWQSILEPLRITILKHSSQEKGNAESAQNTS